MFFPPQSSGFSAVHRPIPTCMCIYCMAKRGQQLQTFRPPMFIPPPIAPYIPPQYTPPMMTPIEPQTAVVIPEPPKYEEPPREQEEIKRENDDEKYIRHKNPKRECPCWLPCNCTKCCCIPFWLLAALCCCLALLALLAGAAFLALFLTGIFPATTITTATTATTTTVTTTTTSTTTTTTTTSTTTTSTTTPTLTFNQTCTSGGACSSALGLTCSSTYSVCVCSASGYTWSYTSSTCVACNSGWTAYLDSCIRYYGQSTGLNYANADSFCTGKSADLLEIESTRKFNFVYNLYTAQTKTQSSVWIQGKTTVAKTFTWSNGNAVNSAFFGTGEPNNSGGTGTTCNECCLEFNTGTSSKLNDAKCSQLDDVYCEYFP